MIDQTLQQLIEAIKNIAPEVWRIAIRQVQANAFETGAWVIFGLAIGITGLILGIKLIKNGAKNKVDEEVLGGAALASFFGILPIILSVNGIGTIIHYLYNPEYYAITLLIGTLTGK